MKYLTVDGMMSGTGIRDSVEGGYINLDEIDVSDKLKNDLRSWLSEYEAEHYRGYKSNDRIKLLDDEGISLAVRLSNEFPDSKVEYYSDAKTKKIYFQE